MKLFILAMLLLTGIKAAAQQSQVTISYSIKTDSITRAAKTSPGFTSDTDRMVVYYKQGKSLTDMRFANPSKMLITNTSTIWLFTSPELNYFIRYPAGFGNANNNNGQIIYLDSTRQIAGYICKKAIIKENVRNKQDSIIVWYTQQLPVIRIGLLYFSTQKLKGTPLEPEMILGGSVLKINAQNVSVAPIPDAVFRLPLKGAIEMPYTGRD